MIKILKRSSVLVLVAALLMVPVAAPALETATYDVSDASIAGDFILCRPIGVLATVLGSALFVASLPFSFLGGNVNQCAEALIAEPARFTFNRPLGKFK